MRNISRSTAPILSILQLLADWLILLSIIERFFMTPSTILLENSLTFSVISFPLQYPSNRYSDSRLRSYWYSICNAYSLAFRLYPMFLLKPFIQVCHLYGLDCRIPSLVLIL